MADDHDDDATRIYRPYGSPPPEPSEGDTAPSAADPFAPPPPSGADPFAPTSRTDPAPGDDPFRQTAPSDPFATDPPPLSDPPASRPSDTASDPFASSGNDPFAPASRSEPAGADPFAPSPSSSPDPFAPPPAPSRPPAAAPPAAAPPSDPDPFRQPDPFGGPVPADPFAAPSSRSSDDPFAPSRASTSDTWDATPADPFAQQPTPVAPVGSDRPDPFAQRPGTASSDPFADFQGAAISSGAGFDSGFHPARQPGVEVEIPKAFGTEETLAGAFTPVFSLVLQIRASDDLGDPTALRQRIEALLSESAQTARRIGASDADVDEATFCLIAFLDEAILASNWHGRDSWSAQPLQLAHYDRYDAGEQFFNRLKTLLDTGGRRAVLEVYYLCLALGFKGRYAIQGREVLRRLVDDLHGRLEAGNQAGALAPRGTSREVAAQAEKAGLPTWALWLGAAALVALVYLVLSLMLSSAAGETADDLRTLSAQSE